MVFRVALNTLSPWQALSKNDVLITVRTNNKLHAVIALAMVSMRTSGAEVARLLGEKDEQMFDGLFAKGSDFITIDNG